MRYADGHPQAMFEQAQRAGGRPANSSGWGMLDAVKSGTYTSERDPANTITIEAGTTRVCRGYWLAVERPELFRPADKRDSRTLREHSANLERTRQELERGMPPGRAPRRKGVLAPKGVLPPKPPFRLPRPAKAWKLP